MIKKTIEKFTNLIKKSQQIIICQERLLLKFANKKTNKNRINQNRSNENNICINQFKQNQNTQNATLS